MNPRRPAAEPNPAPPTTAITAADLADDRLTRVGQHLVVELIDDYDITNVGVIPDGTRAIARWPAGSQTSTRWIELHLPRGVIPSATRTNTVVTVPTIMVNPVGRVDL